MIAHLRGKLLAKHPNQAIVETAGVGYDVTISVPTFSELPAPGSEVALHIHTHVREDALALLSPPFPKVRVIARSGGIQAGARVELRIAGFTWVAVHTVYLRNALFVDQQVQGPFATWIHRHEFEDAGGKTRLTDRLEFQLHGGPAVNGLFGWMVKTGLRHLFHHRHRVTRAFCEKP